ncbi:hypothetical protein [Hyphomonas sp.]|uniref:hypothetical protein n=1 Tax=Hyphomonas sp. TaxID=87 RepID=UPI0025C04F0E|nr:hypothetical protein [Hyphomonas sp.]MBA4339837.1 hypothetical protein [Hyphomonas sp.]
MDFRFLFLEPQGRLAPRPFGRGLVLLTGACMMISVLTAVVSPGLNVLQYALVFPYICLFGKRLHDAGLTAWLWIAFLAGLGFLNMFLSAILLPVLSPGAFAIQVEVQETMQTVGFAAAFEELALRAEEYARLSAVTTLAAFLISSAITGFAAFRLRSDPKPNRHGPPTLGGPAGTFN